MSKTTCFNLFYKERSFHTENERALNENCFNERNTKNFECSYHFSNEIDFFLTQKNPKNTVCLNVRILSKNFGDLLDVLRYNNHILTFFA